MNQLQSFLENICIILYTLEKKRVKILFKANLKKLIKTEKEMKLKEREEIMTILEWELMKQKTNTE